MRNSSVFTMGEVSHPPTCLLDGYGTLNVGPNVLELLCTMFVLSVISGEASYNITTTTSCSVDDPELKIQRLCQQFDRAMSEHRYQQPQPPRVMNSTPTAKPGTIESSSPSQIPMFTTTTEISRLIIHTTPNNHSTVDHPTSDGNHRTLWLILIISIFLAFLSLNICIMAYWLNK